MIVQIFGYPFDNQNLFEQKKGDINDVLSFEYEKFFCGVGTFTMELPITTVFASELVVNNLLYLKDDDMCFIIKDVKYNNDKITVVGYDLNGMLLDRITLPRDTGIAGAEGKDCITGSTETCVKHFVDYNMISSPDIFRNYPRLSVAEDLNRGIAEDSDLVGKECLEDVVRTMCEGAGLGYRISLSAEESLTKPVLIFDVYEQEDHSADQSERNRVIFSAGLGNLTEIEREVGVTSEKNAVWCETGGVDMFVYRDSKLIPSGWDRREEFVSLSVADSYDVQEIELTTRKQMEDKYAATDSLTVEAGNPLDYGKVYKVGDIVTTYDKKRSVQLNAVISSALVKRTGDEYTVQLSLGERKPKLLDKYVKQSQLQRKTQTDFPPSHTGGNVSHGNIDTYQYISDNSIKYNDLTYTVEKDESGLISRIYDDDQGEFLPEISGEISDIAFHNAVFTAIAMLCGLPKPEAEDTLTDMVQYRYNNDASVVDGSSISWSNQAVGADNSLVWTGSSKQDGGIYITGAKGSVGTLTYAPDAQAVDEYTIYLVACGVTASSVRFFNSSGSGSLGTAASIYSDSGLWRVTNYVNGNPLASSGVPSTSKAVVVMRRKTDGSLEYWVNGNLIDSAVAGVQLIAGSFSFGWTFALSGLYDGNGFYFYDFALAETAHSEADILTNSKYLMAKYNITT